MRADQQQLSERLYVQGASFCLTDLSAVDALLDEAQSSRDERLRTESLARARRIVDGVARVVPRLHLTYNDLGPLCEWVTELDQRLRAAERDDATLRVDVRRSAPGRQAQRAH
jgi:hypothetical protein